jgi:hypothetical protein
MKVSTHVLLVFLIALSTTVCHADSEPTLSCKPGGDPATPQPAITSRLVDQGVRYTLAEALVAIQQSSGVGAGKIQFKTGFVNVKLSENLDLWFKALGEGAVFQKCTLHHVDTTGRNLDLELVGLQSIQLIHNPEDRPSGQAPEIVVRIHFLYGGLHAPDADPW